MQSIAIRTLTLLGNVVQVSPALLILGYFRIVNQLIIMLGKDYPDCVLANIVDALAHDQVTFLTGQVFLQVDVVTYSQLKVDLVSSQNLDVFIILRYYKRRLVDDNHCDIAWHLSFLSSLWHLILNRAFETFDLMGPS